MSSDLFFYFVIFVVSLLVLGYAIPPLYYLNISNVTNIPNKKRRSGAQMLFAVAHRLYVIFKE